MIFNVFLKHLVCFNYSVYLGCVTYLILALGSGGNIFLTTASSVFELFEFLFSTEPFSFRPYA